MTAYVMPLSCYPWWKPVHSVSCSQKLSLGGYRPQLFQFCTCAVFVGHLDHYVLMEGNVILNHAWILTTDLCLSLIHYLSSGSPHPYPWAPTWPCAYSWLLYLHFWHTDSFRCGYCVVFIFSQQTEIVWTVKDVIVTLWCWLISIHRQVLVLSLFLLLKVIGSIFHENYKFTFIL